jgi:predicted transcriptional regulator
VEARGDVTRQKLGELLLWNSPYISLDDSILVATATMLDHGVSWLPVVHSKEDLRPAGCLRGEKIGTRMIQKLSLAAREAHV